MTPCLPKTSVLVPDYRRFVPVPILPRSTTTKPQGFRIAGRTGVRTLGPELPVEHYSAGTASDRSVFADVRLGSIPGRPDDARSAPSGHDEATADSAASPKCRHLRRGTVNFLVPSIRRPSDRTSGVRLTLWRWFDDLAIQALVRLLTRHSVARPRRVCCPLRLRRNRSRRRRGSSVLRSVRPGAVRDSSA